jgi:hypothetical protein
MMLSEGLRIARLSAKRKKEGWKRYDGGMKSICDGILRDCWNGEFYRASAGHFCQFYVRDFGISVESLDNDKAVSSLSYALQKFRDAGAVYVAITPDGKPFDFPAFSPDSLAFLLRALRIAKAYDVAAAYQDFLEAQIVIWCDKVLDKDGFVKKGVHFGGMRDHAVRSSSCYDNCMVLLLKQEAKKLGLKTPEISLTVERFVDDFWVEDHFKDSMESDVISGDANVIPFWLGLVESQKMAKSALQCLHKLRMDRPIPLSYSQSGKDAPRMIWQNAFVKGWESEAKWMQLGLMFAAVAKDYDKPLFKEVAESLRKNVLANQNVLEVFTPDGKPYVSTFYHADEGMLWGAALAKRILQSRIT